jgi:hypothetical protein
LLFYGVPYVSVQSTVDSNLNKNTLVCNKTEGKTKIQLTHC